MGYASGTVEKLVLPSPHSSRETTFVEAFFREVFDGHGENIIESLSASSTHILSVASSGTACLRPLSSSQSRGEAAEEIDMEKQAAEEVRLKEGTENRWVVYKVKA